MVPVRNALCLVVVLWSVAGCAQMAREPSPALEVATESRAALSGRELRAEVIRLLDTRAGEEELRKLGPESVPVLRQILNASSNRQERRLRAVMALGLVSAPEASEALRAVLGEKKLPAAYRGAAAEGLARREGRTALEELQPYLEDPKPELRLGAARALGFIGGPDARAAVEERIGKELDPKLRAELQQIVTGMNP